MKITLVAAVAENGVIGVDGEMPWHYPEDLKRFKQLTVGHPVIVGRRTHESIVDRLGGPLPDRTSIVLSRRESLDLREGAIHARSVEEALGAAESALDADQQTVHVIGGESVYEAFLDLADEIRVTEIPETPAGDTRFPEIGPEWVEHDRETVGELAFVTYRR